MKNFYYFLLLNFFIAANFLLAQDTPPVDSLSKIDRVEKIYQNLEYNTTAFNDLKMTWIVTDPVFVREIFNRFIVRNALRLDGKKPSLEQLKQKSKDIYLGNVFIELRRRYYDDEIEVLRFFTESKLETIDTSDFFFDPTLDYVYIQEVLGNDLYQDLKRQFYAMNDITKTYYDSKFAYNFDIYLHLLNPELMFWSVTTDQRNKFLASIIGRWGNNNISVPGWFYPNYIGGVKVTYIDYLINNRPNNTYVLEIGGGFPSRQPLLGFEKDNIGKRIFHTGSNFYFKFVGDPFKLFLDDFYELELDISGSFSLTELKVSDFGINYLTQFQSIRNYFVFMVRKKELLSFSDVGSLYAGLGLGLYDVYNYLLDPKKTNLQDLEGATGHMKINVSSEVGVFGEGGLLGHDITVFNNFNFTEGNGYVGVKMYFMLTGVVGFDFRFFSNYRFGNKALPFYRSETYITFSPVFRINY